MADDSVVVMKSRPEKAGNRLEGKTGMIRRRWSVGGRYEPKALSVAKGGSLFGGSLKLSCTSDLNASRLPKRGTLSAVSRERTLLILTVHRSSRKIGLYIAKRIEGSRSSVKIRRSLGKLGGEERRKREWSRSGTVCTTGC